MKALFIWRKDSKSFIEDNNQFGGDAKFITSQEEFDDFIPKDKRGLKESEKKKETRKENVLESYTKIYILAELGWNKQQIFEGYEKGFQLINKWNANEKAPCIYFYSLVNRKIIYNKVPDNFKFVVKAFPFRDLLEIKGKYKFPSDDISLSKWTFFKTYALENYGILDVISHRLDGLDEKGSDFEIDLNSVINELKSYKIFTGKAIQKFILNIKYTNSYIADLKFLIENRIEELTGETKQPKFKLPETLNLVVIEDNKEDQRVIINGLRRHYKTEKKFNDKVNVFSNGREALNFINKNDVDIIITDLQLLDEDEFYQEIQGVEIFDTAKNLKSTVIGIITGFGRKGVSKLLGNNEKFILLKKHLKRFNANEEIDLLLKSLYDEYQKKIKTVYYNAGTHLGWMKNSAYRKYYSDKINEDKTIHNDIYKKAKNYAELYLTDELDNETEGWDSTLLKTENIKNADLKNVFDKHYSFLAQRLIVLSFYIKNNKVYEQGKFEEVANKFIKRESLNKSYLTSSLGFSTSLYSSKNKLRVSGDIIKEGEFEGQNKEDVRIISFKDLFPEEREWIKDKLNFDEKLSIKSQSKECARWLRDNFNQFFPDTDFDAISFDDFYELLGELEKRQKDEVFDENAFSKIVEFFPKEVEQYLTKQEKKIIKKINTIYDNII